MKTNEVSKVLMTLGWKNYTDDVGDKFSIYHFPDRIVNIIYRVRKSGEDQLLSFDLTASTGAFSYACKSIYPQYGNYASLIRRQKGLSYQVPVITEEHVRQATAEAVAWVKELDLERVLREHAARPTNSPGTFPILHLAALTLQGDVAKLKSYQASFEAGDRLGFVVYVTKDHIDRAVALAEEWAKK